MIEIRLRMHASMHVSTSNFDQKNVHDSHVHYVLNL